MLPSHPVVSGIASSLQLALLWKELMLSSGIPVVLVTVLLPRPSDTLPAVSLTETQYSQIALKEPRASLLYLDVRLL